MDLAGVPWSEIGQTWLTELMNEETFTCGEEKLPEHQQTRAEAPRDLPPNVTGWEAAENATRLAWSLTRRRTNKSAPKSNGHRARWRQGQGRELGPGREGPAAPPRAAGSVADRREPREPPTHGSDVKRRCRLSAQGRRAPTARTGTRPAPGDARLPGMRIALTINVAVSRGQRPHGRVRTRPGRPGAGGRPHLESERCPTPGAHAEPAPGDCPAGRKVRTDGKRWP